MHGAPVHPQRGWEYLKRLDMTRRRPRPVHEESDPVEQKIWKKKLKITVEQVGLPLGAFRPIGPEGKPRTATGASSGVGSQGPCPHCSSAAAI